MRLAKVTLAGFKSFADRTEFTFDAPITGIVGPNGCGKSNVVDAIKWVLGERSAKSLRGKEMEDVIFAGSAGRKPLGMASVTLSFNNPVLPEGHFARRPVASAPSLIPDEDPDQPADHGPDHADETPASPLTPRAHAHGRGLNIDAETVEIERRLHRDGGSEYLINGRKARLRDIRELFMDTGVGADAYCIIEQGKVDAMLLASPTERRNIFEEAAGIARFRARRLEAERKLERTETNLVRAREQLDSTERRLRIVKGQAAKARLFKDLDARLRERRSALTLDQYHDLRRRLEGLTSQITSLDEARRHASSRLQELEDGKQRAELRRHELLNQRQAAEHDQARAQQTAQAAGQRRAMAERSIAEGRQHLAQDEARLADLEAQSEALSHAAAEAEASAGALEADINAAESRQTVLAAERQQAQAALSEQRAQVHEKRSQAADIDRRRSAALAEAEGERRRAETLAEQLRRLADRAASLDQSRTQLSTDLAAASASALDHAARAEALDARAAALETDAAALGGDQRTLSEQLGEIDHERVRLDSRRATLREMIDARTGLGDAARHVLAQRDAGAPGCAGVLAPLAELIRVDAAHAAAAEAALGPALQALLVDSLASIADSPILRGLPGRVTFIPAAPSAAGAAAPAPSAAEHDLLRIAPHRLIPISSLIHVDPRAADAIARILGRTYLVDSPEAAMMLLAGPMASLGARFVTSAGEVIEPDGRIVAGPMTGEESGRGLLERRAEYAELESRLAAVTADVDARRAALASLDERAASLAAELGRHRAGASEARRSLAADDARRERLTAELARLDREASSLAEETNAAESRLRRLAEERSTLLARADSLTRLAEEHAAGLASLESAADALESRLAIAGEALAAARVAASQAAERLASAQRESRRLAAAIDDARRQSRSLAEQLAHRRARIAEHERTVAECDAQSADAASLVADAARRIDSMAGALLEATEDARRLAEAVSLAREHAHAVERDWQSLEISRRELEVRRESLEERAQTDLSMDLPLAYARWVAEASDREPIDQQAFTAEIETLRAEIARLGNINLDAIDEESLLESRNEELIRQVADIDHARTALEDLIRRLNDASRDRFRETFEAIQSNFAGKDGMFRKLFGGGRAELRLIPSEATGEIDWLESGVDVVAKPPGKEPRAISQLSGGEKTMTAVALLMSIFVSKPSPFCILDEVDAALDEANVGRFCAVVRQFLDHSHFIVITHNKRTMSEADQLFGVTMQERGVSRRVRVRFEDVGEHGHIKPHSAAPDDAHPTAMDDEPAQPAPQPGSLRAALAAMRAPTDAPVSVN